MCSVTRWFVYDQLHKDVPLSKILEQCPNTDEEEIIEGIREYIWDKREGKSKKEFTPVYGIPIIFRTMDEIIESNRRRRQKEREQLRERIEKILNREDV